MRDEARSTGTPLPRGLRVLVTEDRALIASSIARALHGAGCRVLGPYPTLREGLGMVRGGGADALDAAVLDIDLRGEAVYPLAEALCERSVPFLFLTGYGGPAIPAAWRNTPRLEKPSDAQSLVEALVKLVGGGGGTGAEGTTVASGEPPDAVRRVWETIRRQRDLVSESQARMERAARGAKPGG